jgi:hypothetical protein
VSVPRGLWWTFAAFCVVVGIVTIGYVTRVERPRAPVPASIEEIPLEPGSAYVIPDAGPSTATVPQSGSGHFVTAGGGSSAVGSGHVYRYTVVAEDGSGVAAADFAAAVERTLADPRGWTASGRWGFQRVSGGTSDLTVHLATPATTDRLCDSVGVETRGEVSCRGGHTVVINLKRWLLGVPWYSDALDEYRHMVVNHEVGHFLGHGHVACSQPGGPAPVMQRQTFGLEGCVRNAWPFPDQRTFVTGRPIS